MCIKEYIGQQLGTFGVELSECFLTAEINALGYDECLEINAKTRTIAQTIMYEMIPMLMTLPTSISEGGYSISYDREALLKYYDWLCESLGKENSLSNEPIIKDITNQW